MTNHRQSNWSDGLQQQTRDAIRQLPMTPDDCLHFKHATLGFAFATQSALARGRLVLLANGGDAAYEFDDVDALLQAGWALD